ncbi:hypothetical protein HZF05_07190 [Sphingomonas sp. CGMCC 1.13654]|uniref:ParA family protein n=1 Tax=Sphingomonas chungangi TaxID=2683589 RepID=A0A838L316_9SPHN|nr:hypothetical protein [Sphingomonas chungangi]MBA2933883.1 hypothetical protein [Sphingomonas chungangi]MVW55212.1 hypothetical protein [Sphingomonas chungangi]
MTEKRVVHVLTTVKGGAGKTETTDMLEAVLTLTGHRCTLVDVDDGNRGLARRVGVDNVVKLDWTSGIEDAPGWVAQYGSDSAHHLLFDLGAGISSSDTPVMAFLQTVWRMLHNEGARIIFYCIVSTNAPTSRFVERMVSTYGKIGTILIVHNDQDGSRAFPADIANRAEPQIDLRHQAPGIQEVRLRHRARLSAVIANPLPGYRLATALMATRVHAFARQLAAVSIIDPASLAALDGGSPPVPRLMYSTRRSSDATDERILCNGKLHDAHHALLANGLSDSELLTAAKAYRAACASWQSR